jgi:hypothetical protein
MTKAELIFNTAKLLYGRDDAQGGRLDAVASLREARILVEDSGIADECGPDTPVPVLP